MENTTRLPHAPFTFSSGQTYVLLWAPHSEFYLYLLTFVLHPSCEI